MALALGSSTASAVTLFSDDFDGGASAAWGNQAGAWRTDGGTYDAGAPSNAPLTYTGVTTLTSLTDFILDVDVNNVMDGGIWLRSSYNGGAINGVLLVTNALGAGLYWHTVQNGVITGTSSGPTLSGGDHHIRVTAIGNLFTAFLDGAVTPATSLMTNLFVSGSAGLYDFGPRGGSSPRGQTFDNFVITAVPIPAALPLLAGGLAGLGLMSRFRRRPEPAV